MATMEAKTQKNKKQVSIRSMYVAEKDNIFVSCDLSQAESWIVAYSANDPGMKHSLNNSDIHKDNGAAIFFEGESCLHKWNPKDGAPSTCLLCEISINKAQRYLSKRVNHAKSYRMGPFKMAQVINKDFNKPPFITISNSEAKILSDRWEESKPQVTKVWWNEIVHDLRINNCTLRTCYGRVRRFYQQWGEELFKEATAFLPQSTVSDHTKGMVHPELGIKGGIREIYYQLVKPYKDHKIVNEKHDSVTLEVPIKVHEEIYERMISLMERPIVIKGEEFTIPVDGEVGERWDGSSR